MEQLTFSNAKGTSEVHKYTGGARRVQGEFFFSPDMRWFPLDDQRLEIVLEQLQSPVAEFAFVPDFLLNGMSPAVRFPGWQASLRPRDHADNRANCYTKVHPPTTVTWCVYIYVCTTCAYALHVHIFKHVLHMCW